MLLTEKDVFQIMDEKLSSFLLSKLSMVHLDFSSNFRAYAFHTEKRTRIGLRFQLIHAMHVANRERSIPNHG